MHVCVYAHTRDVRLSLMMFFNEVISLFEVMGC